VTACRSGTPGDEAKGRPPARTVPAVFHDAQDLAARDRFRRPDRVVAALGLAKGQRVADVGAGRGYLTFRLAEAVGPTGRVVATDIDDAALGALRAHKPAPGNIVARRVSPDDPGLEAGAYDLVLLSEVDHYLPDRVAYLRKLHAALAPGGRIAVTNRRAFRTLVLDAAERAGYALAGEVTDLPVHFLVFLKPASKGLGE
jgi:predicted methyltransferase